MEQQKQLGKRKDPFMFLSNPFFPRACLSKGMSRFLELPIVLSPASLHVPVEAFRGYSVRYLQQLYVVTEDHPAILSDSYCSYASRM